MCLNDLNVVIETQCAFAESGTGYVLSTGREGSDFENSVLKWGEDAIGASGGRVTWSLSLAGLQFAAGFVESQFIAAANAAFDAWENIADIDFEFMSSGDVDVEVVTRTLEGTTVGLASYSFGTGPVRDNDVAIMTSTTSNGPATIDMDLEPVWSPNGEQGLSYYAVLLHEIGHILGLDHVADTTQIMNFQISTDDLGAGDIAGAQFLYGARLATDGADDLDLSGLFSGQTIRLAAGNDRITATDFADVIYGGAGDDTVNGSAGNDRIIDALGVNTLNGGGDDDVIIGGGRPTTATGGQGNDIMIGGAGDDTLSGGTGNDTIRGDPANSFFHGNDRLTAGAGNDFLQGGGGADTFVFLANENTNTIARLQINQNDPAATTALGADFESGIDRIDVSGFGYTTQAQAFGFVSDVDGTAQFSDLGTTIVFFGLQLADLSESDFII